MLSIGVLKRVAAVLLFAVLAVSGASCVSSSAHVRPGVEMLLMPGTSKAIPMPPEDMRAKIEKRMERGDVPSVIKVSAAGMERRCRATGHLLGCVTDTSCKLGLIYVREGMSRELEHMVRVHEYAHCLYGWKH